MTRMPATAQYGDSTCGIFENEHSQSFHATMHVREKRFRKKTLVKSHRLWERTETTERPSVEYML